MLRVERLQVTGLPPLNFEVPDGDCLAIEGASGAGKTLVLRALADLDASAGDVSVDGVERREMPAHIWRRRVRYCAAEPAWWAHTPRACLPPPPLPRLDRLMQALDLDLALLDRPIPTLSTGDASASHLCVRCSTIQRFCCSTSRRARSIRSRRRSSRS